MPARAVPQRVGSADAVGLVRINAEHQHYMRTYMFNMEMAGAATTFVGVELAAIAWWEGRGPPRLRRSGSLSAFGLLGGLGGPLRLPRTRLQVGREQGN